VREGYREWAATYEDTVQDEMDLRLLSRLRSVRWAGVRRAVDLACGTGRTGLWLRKMGVEAIDGVDLTPEMLSVAKRRRIYARLRNADALATGLAAAAYDVCIEVLADEHIADLGPLYREAARLTRARGTFVIVGYHPYFLMAGIPTHFDAASGEPIAIESHVHLFSDHVKAAGDAGWALVEMEEGLIDERWVARKPKWEKYRDRPVSFAMVWRKKAPSHRGHGSRGRATPKG
jgi:SAM-dependent methyltransferase